MAHGSAGTSGFALDIGNTKVHGQVRDAGHKLLDDWTVATSDHASLEEVISRGYKRAQQALGAEPGFVGLGFGGPVDSRTGAAKLALVTAFSDTVTLRSVSQMLGGVPVVHLNDVAASAHALDFPHFAVDTTLLTQVPEIEVGPSVLLEIGTGVGTAYCLPNGTVMPSEAVRIHASNGRPYGLNICGSQGFKIITQELQAEGVAVPDDIATALKASNDLGPIITARVGSDNPHEFIQAFRRRYAQYLGELLGTLQLAFLATRIFIGGSVGRAPMFLEKLIEAPELWAAFAKEDALRDESSMPILRVNDLDATVRGAYAAAFKQSKSL